MDEQRRMEDTPEPALEVLELPEEPEGRRQFLRSAAAAAAGVIAGAAMGGKAQAQAPDVPIVPRGNVELRLQGLRGVAMTHQELIRGAIAAKALEVVNTFGGGNRASWTLVFGLSWD